MLAESWRIGRCGIDYCARMVRTAKDDDERRLFGLVGADEARHAGWLAPGEQEPDPFNRFIAALAETGTPQALAFLLQVVLEGFGITHYSALAATFSAIDAGAAGAVNLPRLRRLMAQPGMAWHGWSRRWRPAVSSRPARRPTAR